MNADILLRYFDRISEAPDAIPRLRRFILDLAVRGKLVEQDPRDEPASKLLKRIQAEKARLVKEGRAKKEKALSPIVGKEIPFPVPVSWSWVRLQEITSYIQRGKSPVYASDDGFPVISQKCVQWQGLDLSSARLITNESVKKYEEVRFLRENDLLWNSTGTGTIGRIVRVASLQKKLVCDSHVTVVRCALANAEYVRSWLCSDHVYQSIEDRAAGSTNQVELTAQMATNQVVPLPPLAEQQRIVAKVDELMALCDQLEAARNEREARRQRLTAASLQRLNQPADAAALRADARFHLDNLTRLTTRPEQIKQLRQTILNLAVRGCLVQQDPQDEPASELLKRIEKNRAHLFAEKKIPKPKILPRVKDLELPFAIPVEWSWTMLGSLCYQVSDGPHFSPSYVSQNEGVPFLSTRNVRLGGFDLSNLKYVSKENHAEFCKRIRPEKGDIIYTKGGTTGIARVNDLDFEFSVWVHLAVLRIAKEFLCPRYIELTLNSPLCYEQSQLYTQGISNFDLGLTRMIKIVMPLPPLAEQHRIVARVDELMALCDQLETQLTTTATDSRRLLEAVLRDAIRPQAQA